METKLFSPAVQPSDNKQIRPSVNGQSSELTQSKNTEKTTVSSVVMAKNQLNAAIVQSTVDVSASSKYLSLTFKTAIQGINDALKGTMGENAIQSAYDSGLDFSPEATADRIVSLSTAFFGSYQQQHPELSQEDALIKFADIISGGINTGFTEARNILSGLQVLKGDIASNIDVTYDLVQQKLTSFIDSFNRTSE